MLALTHVGGSVGCPVVLDSAYAMAVLADSPLAYWQCQDLSGFPIDSSGNGNDVTSFQGSATGITYRNPGVLTSSCDKSMCLSIREAQVAYPVTTQVANFTLEMWLYFLHDASNSLPFIHVGWQGNNGYNFFINSSDKMRYTAEPGALGAESSALTSGTWYHLAVTRGASIWKYYINGSLDVANAGTDTPAVPTLRTRFSNNLDGYFCEHVAIYGTELSAAQIASHYAAR